jgi:hypothetical protein
MRIRELLGKAPLWILIPLTFLLFYISVFVYVLVWPFVFLYGVLFLCPMLRVRWGKKGKDILVVSADTEDARQWSARITPHSRNASRLS